MDQDFEIFEGKTFTSLCKDIVDNQIETKSQIDVLITELKPLIKTPNDAMMIVPLIRDYLDIGVKNNEHLIKLAAITNKIKSKYESGFGDGGNGPVDFDVLMTDDEKEEIAKHIRALQSNQNETGKQIESLKSESK